MDVLDDIFDEEELDGDELKQLEKRLLTNILFTWGVNSIIWLIVALKDDIISIGDIAELLLVISIFLMVSPSIACLMLALLVAIFPYKDYDYQNRFPRAFLLTLLTCYIGLILYGIGSIIMHYT